MLSKRTHYSWLFIFLTKTWITFKRNIYNYTNCRPKIKKKEGRSSSLRISEKENWLVHWLSSCGTPLKNLLTQKKTNLGYSPPIMDAVNMGIELPRNRTSRIWDTAISKFEPLPLLMNINLMSLVQALIPWPLWLLTIISREALYVPMATSASPSC